MSEHVTRIAYHDKLFGPFIGGYLCTVFCGDDEFARKAFTTKSVHADEDCMQDWANQMYLEHKETCHDTPLHDAPLQSLPGGIPVVPQVGRARHTKTSRRRVHHAESEVVTHYTQCPECVLRFSHYPDLLEHIKTYHEHSSPTAPLYRSIPWETIGTSDEIREAHELLDWLGTSRGPLANRVIRLIKNVKLFEEMKAKVDGT